MLSNLRERAALQRDRKSDDVEAASRVMLAQ